MFLSRLTLHPAHPHARRDLASAYEMHRSLARAFAPDANSKPARFLWRLESDRSDLAGATVLVQAAQAGEWRTLIEQPGYLQDLQANKLVATDRLVRAERACRFRLLANPTVTRAGRRYGLHDENAQLDWLTRQGQKHGFVLLNAERSAHGRITAAQGARGCRITLDAVLFEGVLQPTNATTLRIALLAGIGPGKALGLGMLSLAPMQAPEVS
jgi:CRISPR system Cascade subunit CasE